MENLGYLFAAYSVVWAALFIYLITVHSAQRNLRRQIDSLRETLKEKGER